MTEQHTQPAHDTSNVERPDHRVSRRSILGAAGISVGAMAIGGGGAVVANRRDRGATRGNGVGRNGQGDGTGRPADSGGADIDRFSRMFDVERFAEPSEELTEALTELGRRGGPMDANDPLEVGPIRLITEPELSPDNPDNPTHTAGVTFVGQFLDHDLTRDAGSQLNRPTGLQRSVNLRTARLDLDSVYGGGPGEMRELYDADDLFRLRVESGGAFEDLPRGDDGRAVLGDERNDENLMLNGLHCAFLMAHNEALTRVRANGLDGVDAFNEARQQVRWHYQWLIVNEWLPQFVGQEMVDDVRTGGRRFYTDARPRIPVEFQTAAYRFGHSMVRPSYRANLAGDDGEPFFGFVFSPDDVDAGDPDDPDHFVGGHRAARRFIGWQTFFDFGDGEARPNKRIDTKLSTPLFQLPIFAIGSSRGEDIGPISLATRNLLRHTTWRLPSGQRLASLMGEPVLGAADLPDLDGLGAGLQASTPLWYYILREAELVADGLHLGPVGGRIVAEVFLGLLELDPTSYLHADDWQPTWPVDDATTGFRTTDLLRMAGVDPERRGQ